MTWNARDCLPAAKPGGSIAPPRTSSAPHDPEEGTLSPPVPLPTYAQAQMYQSDEDDGAPIRWTLEEERALRADGIWPEREWAAWRYAMIRGIQAE